MEEAAPRWIFEELHGKYLNCLSTFTRVATYKLQWRCL
jgi:hypothetical protein